MTRKIAYYISDYGFGHASRCIALVREILKVNHKVKVIICCSFALNFIKASLKLEDMSRIAFRQVKNDFGYVLKENSIDIDFLRMEHAYEEFVQKSVEYVQAESAFLLQESVHLVISDISPLPFLAAKMSNCISIGISNFTWYTAYEQIIFREKLQFLFQAYDMMDYFIPLAGASEPDWKTKLNVPQRFFSREVDSLKVREIIDQINPDNQYFLVFFGLGMKIGIDGLTDLPIWNSHHCRFVVSANVSMDRENVIQIPVNETETQNYVAACDLVISKPGWGIISEAVQSGRPLLILERGNMREDQCTIDYLLSNKLGRVINWLNFREFQITDSFKEEIRLITRPISLTENSNTIKQIVAKISERFS